jgi:WD40 repeat protein
MEKSNSWLLPVCIVFGLATFGVACVMMPEDKKDEPAPIQPFVAAAAPAGPAPVIELRGPGAQPAVPVNPVAFPAPEQQAASNALQPPLAGSKPPPAKGEWRKHVAAPDSQLASIRRRLNVPSDVAPDRFGKSPADILDVAINANATRLITKSKKEIIYWDLNTGKKLQSFLPPKPAWDYQEPTMNRVFVSPDTRIIATLTQNKKHEYLLELHETETKRLLGTAVPEKTTLLHDTMYPTFTASGANLLLYGEARGGGLAVVAIATSNAALASIHRGEKGFKQGLALEVLPSPTEPILMVFRRGETPISTLDLRTGKETPLTAITSKPWHLLFQRGMAISPDGKYVLSGGVKELQVCDWRSNRLVFSLKDDDCAYIRPHFTPDGKRLLFVREPQYDLIYIGGPRSGTREDVPCTLELYDIATQSKLGEFTFDKDQTIDRAQALAISQDGKTIAVAKHTSVFCLDFQAALGVAPLPPMPRPTTDALPLK